jgi:hypothetical protein
MGLGSEIPDLGSGKKPIPGSRIQGSKRHQTLDLDPQPVFLIRIPACIHIDFGRLDPDPDPH